MSKVYSINETLFFIFPGCPSSGTCETKQRASPETGPVGARAQGQRVGLASGYGGSKCCGRYHTTTSSSKVSMGFGGLQYWYWSQPLKSSKLKKKKSSKL